LQVSHIAHVLLAVHTVAAVPTKTANKPLIKTWTLMRDSYEHRRGREANQYSEADACESQQPLRKVWQGHLNKRYLRIQWLGCPSLPDLQRKWGRTLNL